MPGSSRSTAPDEARIAILQHVRGRKRCVDIGKSGFGMFNAIRRDIRAALERDPASRNAREVLLCYPGLHALWFYRVAHWFWRRGGVVTARFISHVGRFFTGIEIHPGAVIGSGLFIDHGMGVVIGETTEIGENVTIYQGVTLGGTSLKREKRHPTLGNNVVVGAGAAILGAITIGDGSRVGGGSVVVNDVPPNSVVVGIPGKVIYRDGNRIAPPIDLEHTDLPDPVSKAIEQLLDRIHGVEAEVEALKKKL
jgi:serine O-acetyltransferase